MRSAGALVPAFADDVAVVARSRSRRADSASSCTGRARRARARAPCERDRRRRTRLIGRRLRLIASDRGRPTCGRVERRSCATRLPAAPRLRASASRKSDTSWNDAIDRREADVGDLVELVELLHHHLADLRATGSRARPATAPAARCGRSPHRRTRSAPAACAARAGSRRESSSASKSERDAVGLDDLRQAQLDRLVGREALLAGRGSGGGGGSSRPARTRASRSPACRRCRRTGISSRRLAATRVRVRRGRPGTSCVSAATLARTRCAASRRRRARRARRR